VYSDECEAFLIQNKKEVDFADVGEGFGWRVWRRSVATKDAIPHFYQKQCGIVLVFWIN
jgi:hypothetical protein